MSVRIIKLIFIPYVKDIKNRPKFDISLVHMRYNKTAINEVMHKDMKKISILRDPVDNFISSWRYYSKLTEKLRKMLPIRIEKYMKIF